MHPSFDVDALLEAESPVSAKSFVLGMVGPREHDFRDPRGQQLWRVRVHFKGPPDVGAAAFKLGTPYVTLLRDMGHGDWVAYPPKAAFNFVDSGGGWGTLADEISVDPVGKLNPTNKPFAVSLTQIISAETFDQMRQWVYDNYPQVRQALVKMDELRRQHAAQGAP